MSASGRLVCIGLGTRAGAHLTPLAKRHIEQSDVVFADAPNALFETALKEMHGDVRSLGQARSEHRPRRDITRAIVETLLTEVRAGKKVCGAFYGYPGMFGGPAQAAIRRARSEGYSAHLEPGISAEGCLYADLELDPARYGCQHYEASQLIRYRRSIDSSAHLVLWNVDVPDDCLIAESQKVAYRKLLLDVLAEEYPPDHTIIVYRPATLLDRNPYVVRMPLALLPWAAIGLHACVVLPPAAELLPDPARQARLAILASQ